MPAAELMKLDKEKLIARIRNAGTPKEAVPVLEAEIDRILAAAVAAEENPRLSEMLSFILRTVRMTVRSADCVKEVRAFEEKTGGRGKQGRSSALPLILLAVGIALIAALFLIAAAAGGFVVSIKLLPVYILLAAGGGALLYVSGRMSAKGGKTADAGNVRYECVADAPQLYRVLHAAMTVADQCVSEAASEEAFDERQEGTSDAAGLTGEELTLLAGLFEAAYSGDAEYMRDKIEELKAVLHRRHIEVVDCSESTHSFFDQMPSEREGTLRPALLSDGKVLRRGLAHEPLLRI